MRRGLAPAVGLVGALLAVPAAAQTPSRPPLKGVGVDERLDAAAELAPALAGASVKASDVGAFVRLIVPWTALEQARSTSRWDTLDARLDALRRAAIPVLLAIEDAPIALDNSATWPDAIRAVAAHASGRVAGYEIDAPRGERRPDARTYAYFLKLAAVQIRSVDPDDLIAQTPVGDGDTAWQTALYASDVALPGFVPIYVWRDGDERRYAAARPGDAFERGEVAFYAPNGASASGSLTAYLPVYDWSDGHTHLLSPKTQGLEQYGYKRGEAAFYAPGG